MASTEQECQFWEMSASEVVQLLKQRKVTPTQLIHAALKRIEETDEAVNATPILCAELALEAARKLEAEGYPANCGPGYLYGLPMLVKDATAVKDVLWTEGSLLFRERLATENDPLVDNLIRNGAIVLGKTNVPELCAGAQTYNRLHGVTRNPWNRTLTAGGSSGGSAAALASGQIWLATGSDLGGSLRIPASFCGIVGLRPSQGVVPRARYKSTPGDCDFVNGPLARNVPDLALLLDAMTGAHPRRLAWAPDLGGLAPVRPDIVRVCEKAVGWFGSAGVAVDVACPDLSDAPFIFQVLRAHAFSEMELPDEATWRAHFKPELVWQLEKGLSQAPEEGERRRRAGTAQVARARDQLQRWVKQAEGRVFDNYVDWLVMSFAFSLVDLPSLSLPVGFTEDGLPVGLQLVGVPGGDAALLAAAAAFERAHDFCRKVPRDPAPAGHSLDGAT